jgi:hypothetical protein
VSRTLRHRPARRRNRVVAAAVAALLAVPLGVAAGTVTVAVAVGRPAFADPAPASPDRAAQTQAVATGKPVTIDADTTTFTQKVANPDGSFTLTSSAQPQRVRRDGSWIPVDAALHTNSDGTLSPAAAIGGLVLSGGGSGPLATFNDGAGHVLSVSMPMPLPAPTVTGDTAFYIAVLPGVDLSVTASIDGGISEILIVHDAAAAANPKLASLRLATSTSGVTLTTKAGGAISATDPATGDTVYTAPPPVMWDSTTSTAATQTNSLHSLDAGTNPAGVDGAGEATRSGVDGPGDNATVTTIPDTASAGAIVLAPPAAALTGRHVTYPVYIDPGISGHLSAWAYTQSYHPTTTAYKPTDNLRVGFDDWTTNCGSPCYQDGIARAFIQFTGLSAIDGNDVTAANLNLTQLSASCSGSYTINAAITSGNASFSSTLDWNNAPDPSGVNDSAAMSGTSGGKQITLTDIGPYMALHNYSTAYLEVYASAETNDCTYRHFDINPTMGITYWSTPNPPASLAVKNGGVSYSCATTASGPWIPKAVNDQITLNDTVSTPDANTQLTSNMYLDSGSGYVDTTDSVTETSANTAIPVSNLITVSDGYAYRWYATANNAYLTSNASPAGAPDTAACYFRYDGSSPTNPTFASTDFPAAGPTTVAAGGSGTITVSAVDLGPHFCTGQICGYRLGSGIAKITYDINGTSISDPAGDQGSVTTTGSANVPVPLSDLHWGTNTLWAQAQDVAGNFSVIAYNFYVQQAAFGPYTPGSAGDIDGDNQPDLVTVDAAGNIRLFSDPEDHSVDPGTPTADPLQYGGTILVSHQQSNNLWPSASFAGALISHNGSFHGNNRDDLIVQHGSTLAVLENPVGAGAWSAFAVTKPATCASSDCISYNGDGDWSNVTQMVAVPTGADKAPDLLTMEMVNGVASLWLYTPKTTSTGYADPPAYNPPTLISGYHSDFPWDTEQLIAAGPLPGNTGETLWLRDPTTGTVRTIQNITTPMTADPLTVSTVRGTGYSNAAYPMLTTVGQADPQGNMLLWATTASGDIVDIPTTTAGSTTTIGTPVSLNATSHWADHETALGATYAGYNHSAVAFNNGGNQSVDGTYAYAGDALRDGTLNNGAQVMTNIPAGFPNCRTWVIDCPPDTADDPSGQLGTPTITGVAGGYQLVTTSGDQFELSKSWAHRPDDYQAAGQTIPAPISASTTFASNISFLGAAPTATTTTATVTYTDGHTQQVTITLAGWTTTGATGCSSVITAAYRYNAATGATNTTATHLYATNDIALLDDGQTLAAAGAQVASITLPTNSNIHIFAVSIR